MAGNQLALFGIHSAIGTAEGVQYTFDSLPVFTAYNQINNALVADGYEGWLVYNNPAQVVTPAPAAVPEPAAAAGLAGVAVLLPAATRRPRRTPAKLA